MDEKKMEEYAILDAQIKLLTDQKDNLKEEILNEMVDNGHQTVDTSVGKFTIATLKVWTYTDKVTELEEQFKAQKASEQSIGLASFEEKPSLRFSQIKF
jgi:hypothetical protein